MPRIALADVKQGPKTDPCGTPDNKYIYKLDWFFSPLFSVQINNHFPASEFYKEIKCISNYKVVFKTIKSLGRCRKKCTIFLSMTYYFFKVSAVAKKRSQRFFSFPKAILNCFKVVTDMPIHPMKIFEMFDNWSMAGFVKHWFLLKDWNNIG